MIKRPDLLPPHALAAFLEGEITPSEREAIEAHLRESGAARGQLEELDEVRQALARPPDDPVAHPDAIAELWRAIDGAPGLARQAGTRRARRRLRVAAWAGALATACAAVALLVRAHPAPPDRPPPSSTALGDGAGEFVAKSIPAAHPEDRWVRLEILRVGSDGAARLLPGGDAVVRAGEPLVMRYVSAGPAPFGYFMAFAVDAAHQIRWYYPAYEAAGTDPASLAIRSGARAVALPDAIEHDLAAGPIVFYGVFTRAPLHVREVERRIRELLAGPEWSPELPPRLPIEDAGQHVIRAVVVP